MNETVLTIIVVVSFTAVLTFFSLKKKNSAWTGVLADKKKKTHTDDQGFTNDTYELIFKTDEGKKVKFKVHKKAYDEYIVGEKYVKVKGDYVPKKA